MNNEESKFKKNALLFFLLGVIVAGSFAVVAVPIYHQATVAPYIKWLSYLDNSSKKPVNEKNTFQTQDKIFAPGDSSLYYKVNDTKTSVDVYSEQGLRTQKILNDFPMGFLSGKLPEFITTSNPDITILEISDGDGGGTFHYYSYIDTKNSHAVTIASLFSGALTITDNSSQKAIIDVSLQNNCVKDAQCNLSGNATIDGITLNGEKTNILDTPKILSCSDIELLNCIKQDPRPRYQGISQDLGKVFFSLVEINYSFDVGDQIIIQEKPSVLLN
jgi:hypothetical protein